MTYYTNLKALEKALTDQRFSRLLSKLDVGLKKRVPIFLGGNSGDGKLRTSDKRSVTGMETKGYIRTVREVFESVHVACNAVCGKKQISK